MKTSLVAGLLISLSFSQAFAESLVIENTESNSRVIEQTLKLSEDGQSCTRAVSSSNHYTVKDNSYTETNSEACNSLKIARRIEEKLGRCDEKVVVTKEQDSKNYTEMVLSGREGISLPGNSLSWTGMGQGCFCGVVTSKTSRIGLGMLNLSARLTDGSYNKRTVKLESMDAASCAKMFASKEDQQIVLDAYRAFGK